MAGNLQAPNLYVAEATGNALRFSSDGYKYITAAPSTGDYLAIVQNPYAAGIQLGKSTVGATNTVVPLMQIDSAGRVTMPYQPAFKAHVVGSPSHVSTSPIPFSTTSLNIGAHFNTANYTFTVPVAGVYVFGGTFRADVAAAYVYILPIINGANSLQSGELPGLSTGNGAGFTAAPFVYFRYLSAGDTIKFGGVFETGGTANVNAQSFLYGYLQS